VSIEILYMLITFSGLTTMLRFDKIVGMIPLFKSHYSIGKSILTLDDPITHKQGGSDSVFGIAVENKLKEVVLVEDSLTGFLQAKKNADNLNLKLIFGLRIDMRENASIDPKEEPVNSSHKIILFARNAQGCKLLNTIYSEAFTEHHNCVDHKVLKKHWNDEHLVLAIPFYDSFIYNNLMKFANCTPSFGFTKPTFFIEQNGLPFDNFLEQKVKNYASKNNNKVEYTKSIYYKNKSDVTALQTYKCITGRTFGNKTLSKPNLDHFGSNEFCFESWKENYERITA
jgi:DNA polymerase III alpha subunit